MPESVTGFCGCGVATESLDMGIIDDADDLDVNIDFLLSFCIFDGWCPKVGGQQMSADSIGFSVHCHVSVIAG